MLICNTRLDIVFAQIGSITFQLIQKVPNWLPIYWGCLFTSVNMIQLGILLNERRPRTFDDSELHLYGLVFKDGFIPSR